MQALKFFVIALLGAAGSVSTSPAQAPPPGPSGAYQQAARLPARIMTFTATPESIQPGQSVTLAWRVENPNSVTIDPEPGSVTARGSKVLTPSATTTYTLTVTGAGNGTTTKTVIVTVAGTKPVNAGAITAKKDIRQVGGHPDLTGVYNSSSINFGGEPVAGTRDPITAQLKPGAEEFKVVRGPTDTGLYADCMPTGVPGAYFVPYQWQIVQGIDRVVIMYEYPHLFRDIPTNVPAHQVDLDPTWMGDAIGRWEGDTLVVETIGFNDKTELPGGFRHTEALHVVERFRRIDYDHLDWEATIEDPNVFTQPWKLHRIYPLRRDLDKVGEFVCENNHDYREFFKK
jgi:hypothetical protein